MTWTTTTEKFYPRRRVVRFDDGDSLTAYCDDGTVWTYDHRADAWENLGIPPIPQPEPPPVVAGGKEYNKPGVSHYASEQTP